MDRPRLRDRTSAIRVRVPIIFSRSFRVSPCCSIRNLMASTGSGGSIGKYRSSYAAIRVASTSSRSPFGVPERAPQSFPTSARAASWSASVRIGLISVAMPYCPDIDSIMVRVGTDPFYEYDRLREIDSNHQPVTVAFDIEDDPVSRYYTGRRVAPLHLGRGAPLGLVNFAEPGIQCRLERGLIAMARTRLDELLQRAPSDDPHAETLSCAHFGCNLIRQGLRLTPPSPRR